MSASAWAQACSAQQRRGQQSLESSAYWSNALAIAAFSASFLFSAYWLLLWARLKLRSRTSFANSPLPRGGGKGYGGGRGRGGGEGEGGGGVLLPPAKIWSQFGAFTAASCAGSLAGVIAWSFNIQSYRPYFASNYLQTQMDKRADYYREDAAGTMYYAFFFTPHAIEYTCTSAASVLILGRLLKYVWKCSRKTADNLAGPQSQHDSRLRRIAVVFKLCAIICVIAGLGGLVGSIGATVVYLKGSAMRLLASSQVNVTTGYDSEASRATDLLADQVFTSGHNWMSVQIVCEAAALISLVLGYVTVGPASALVFRNVVAVIEHARRRHASAATKLDALDHLKTSAFSQSRRLFFCYTLVILTVIPRAAFNVVNSIGHINDVPSTDPNCGMCDTCQNLSRILVSFLHYTPEFQAFVVVIGSPLTLMASVFLTTNSAGRRLLRGTTPSSNLAQRNAEMLRVLVDMTP